MKAAQISEYGDADAIQVVEVERPTVQEGKVLVAVHASSLNPFDTSIRSGRMKDAIPLQLPITLGGDIAGVVEEVGPGVDGVAVGDKVYGQANVVAGNSGAFAEFALTAAGQVAAMPSNLDFAQAASLPLVGVSAVQALLEHIKLAAGKKLFIHGGAGGIGTIAIQIAKHIGAYVATTATGDAIEQVKALGADEVIDYKAEDFATKLQDYDAVFDTVGGDDFTKALGILKRGGVGVSMIAQADAAKVDELGVQAVTQATHVTTAALDKLRELVEAGVVQAQVSKTFPLADIVAAFQARESGTVHGKIVITVK
jgi:NADPH:quinone reductase-like Zn-dependent oxidoreductase